MTRSIYTLFLMTLISISAVAQTTYTITANGNWSASIPTTCINCTINISNNIVLTIDQSVTCMNCTFDGGSITDNDHAISLLYAGTQTTTYFRATALEVYGTGSVSVNAPLSLTNTTFTFNNSSTITTSYELDLTSSTINLYDASVMTSNGGASTDIKLMTKSQINVGNGSQTGTSKFIVSGPTLTLYDKSTVALGNDNNYYSNWANYTYYPSVNANAHASKSNSTQNNNLNCGGANQHSCANPFVYGPSTIGSAGVVTGTPLPIVLEDFTATFNGDKTITLDWNTALEMNSSHITIQRSADGENWDEIGTVQAKGNSATTTAYSFIDEHPLNGNNFYRLQLVDIDNSFTYSVVTVIRTATIGAISFYPNPARDYVNVSLGTGIRNGQTVSVRLVSLSGQVMQVQNTAAGDGTVVSFRVSNYPAGVYILSAVGQDGTRESRELVIGR